MNCLKCIPILLIKKSKALLNTLAKNENKINYKILSYRILLSDCKYHEFNFFKNMALYMTCWKI